VLPASTTAPAPTSTHTCPQPTCIPEEVPLPEPVPLPSSAVEAEEVELLDWGDADEVEDIEAVQVAIDEEDSPATSDLQLRDATEASALESGPTEEI